MKLATLFCVWLLALAGRATLFASGGIGAWICAIAFWGVSVILLAIAVQRLRKPVEEGRFRYILIIVGLLAFGYLVFAPGGLISELAAVVWLLCIVVLLASYVWMAVQHRRNAPSH